LIGKIKITRKGSRVGGVELSDEPDTAQPASTEKAKKKKKRKPAKAEAEDKDEDGVEESRGGAAAEAADDDDEEEEEKIGGAELGLEGFTSVSKKKRGPEIELDDKEKKLVAKVMDLRHRKVGINQQIKKLGDSLSNCTSAEETKVLEARARLQQDLERVNRQIQRLIDPNSAEGDAQIEAQGHSEGDATAWQRLVKAYEGEWDQLWDQWDEWAGADWYSNSWDTRHVRSRRGKGKGNGWEEATGGAAEDEWDWDAAAASAPATAKWVPKGTKKTETPTPSPKPTKQWSAAWWETDASWDAAGYDAWSTYDGSRTTTTHDGRPSSPRNDWSPRHETSHVPTSDVERDRFKSMLWFHITINSVERVSFCHF